VVVRWKPSAAEEADYAATLRTYRTQFVLAVIVVAVLVATLVVAVILGE
jgi:hypothetical protein